MSNPTDPARPDKDQPDAKKPDEAPRGPTERSSFDFELPPEVVSYSDLPPVPQPDASDPGTSNPALPPRPTATAHAGSASFDFIELPPDPAAPPGSGIGLKGVSFNPTPIDPLPAGEVPAPPAAPQPTTQVDDDLFDFSAPVPAADPASVTLSGEVIDLADIVGASAAPPAPSTGSVPDVASLFPSVPPVPEVAAVPDVPPPEVPAVPEPAPAVPDFQLPELEPLSGVLDLGQLEELPVAESASAVLGTPPPAAEPSSDVFGAAPPPLAEPASDLPRAVPPVAEPTSDIHSQLLPPVAEANSDIFGEVPLVTEAASDVFGDDALGLPVAEPVSDSKIRAAAVPSGPVAPAATVPPVYSDLVLSEPLDSPEAPAPGAPEAAAPTPDLDAALADFALPDAVEPVAPASGWLDSVEVAAAKLAAPAPVEPPPVEPPSAEAAPVEAELIEEAAPEAGPPATAVDLVAEAATPAAESIPVGATVAEFFEAEPFEAAAAPPPDPPRAEAPPAEPAEAAEVKPATASRSSFDFQLPSSGELPPVAAPPEDGTSLFTAALPPVATTERSPAASFDFINLPAAPAPGSGTGLQGIPLTPTVIDGGEAEEPPLLTPTSNEFVLPPEGEPPVAEAAGDSGAALGAPPAESVQPASGWLDSAALDAPLAEPVPEPTSDPLAAPPAAAVESSDIFSGPRVAPALPVELSDVIAATAYAAEAVPAEPARPSEVALNFDAPPGGSTAQDSAAGDLPVAEEVGDGSALLAGVADGESIHDMPDPASDPFFDSARLADAPDLPVAPPAPAAPPDAPDYGATPPPGSDASSILADLSGPDGPPGADSSDVRVESPGVDRTLTSASEEVGFDLTLPDEPIPIDLFDEPSDLTALEATDWQAQSGSDLFAERRPAPPDSGRVQPVDDELTTEQPSLTSAPSSIFSGGKPAAGSGASGVPIGTPEAPGEFDFVGLDFTDAADAVEFSDHPTLGETSERPLDEAQPAGPEATAPARAPSSADFQLPDEATQPTAPAEDDGGAIDWDAAELASDEGATRGMPRDASLSAIIRSLSDDSAEAPTQEKVLPEGSGEGPVVSIDWVANSAESSALAEPVPAAESDERPKSRREREKERDSGLKPVKPRRAAADSDAGSAEAEARPARAESRERAKEKTKERPAKKGGGLLVGTLLGALVAGGACAGAYFGGLVPNGQSPGGPPSAQGNKGAPGAAAPEPTIGPKDAFAAGDSGKALELLKAKPAATPDERATAGSVRVYSKLHGAGTDADVKQGQEDLKAVLAEAAKSPEEVRRAVKATVDLGVSYESMGDAAAAKKLFTDARAKFPAYAGVFDALLDRIDSAPGGGTSLRLTPADVERVLLSVGVLLAGEGPKAADAPKADDPEPGLYYWKALRLAREGNYKEAIDLVGKAKAAHVKRARALAGRGLNPLTDPLEQMFPRACDELAAYWKLKGELYSNPAVAAAVRKDGVAKALDAFAQAQKDLAGARTELKAADAKATKLEGEVAKLGKDLKDAEKARVETADKLKVAEADAKALEKKLDTAADALTAAQKDAKEKGEALAAVASELKPAVRLPEKWAPADLVAAARAAAGRATGPDLKVLVPGAMTAIGGGGLSTGQLLDIADRLAKAETAAKVATDKLTTETKKLTDKYEGDIKKVKEDSAAELKKLTDAYAAETKKLKDAAAADAKAQREESAVAVRKLKDANAAEVKKLADRSAADLKKLREDYDAAVKAEQARTEAEKKGAALAAVNFQKQLSLTFSPSAALDLWLPVLTELRRPGDADPAIEIARRALATARPDSDDEAKAHATVGMALLLKGEYPAARDEFQTALRSPAYRANKPWARVADAGLEATRDPLSPYRQPVVTPAIDARAAAKALNDGIVAYRARKYESAVAALSDAIKSDPTDPVAWYFLGAARWGRGEEEQARKDFAQGAEREKVSPLPGRAIGDALAPLQGGVRDAIDKARP